MELDYRLLDLMAVIALLALLTTVTSKPICVPPCICGVTPLRWISPRTFHLSCDVPDEGNLPDWSRLREPSVPISISLYFKTPGAFRKSYLPSNYSVIGLEVKGAQSVDPDGFDNIRHSVRTLLVAKLIMEATWSLPFLSKMESLQYLTLEYDKDVPRPVHVSGTPFKERGVTLRELNLRGGKIASLDPGVFEGLSARHFIFSNEGLATTPWPAFRTIKNMTELEIRDMPMRVIEDGATQGLILTDLKLIDTQTESIAPKAFRGIASTLSGIHFTRNQFKDIPAEALAPLSRLSSLFLTENPLGNITQRLRGRPCLMKIHLGSTATGTNNFKSIHPDVFKAVRGCLSTLSLWNSTMVDVPTEALKVLDDVNALRIVSSAMTRLKRGAFTGLRMTWLRIRAPLEVIEPGAFDDMRLSQPVYLSLYGTRLSSLRFYYDYPQSTFTSIYVNSTALQCDCELAWVRRSMNLYFGRGWYPSLEDSLQGFCYLDGELMSLLDITFYNLFVNCTNATVPDATNGGESVRGTAMLLLAFWMDALFAL